MKKIKVSIIIPVYNGENFIKKCLSSAVSQTYSNFEIIIVNDGSYDKTEEIINEYLEKYKGKIKYFKKDNTGISSTLNYAINKMKGDYFSWLSHDDLYEKNKIKSQVNFINKNKLFGTKSILFGDFAYIDENDNITCGINIDYDYLKKNPKYALLKQLINGLSLLIPKQAFIEYGGFNTDLKCTQDYEKWLEFMNTYNFVHIPGIKVYTRIHSNQLGRIYDMVMMEEEKLFLNIVKSFGKKEIYQLENSEYEFYYKLKEFLITRNYRESLNYCDAKLNELNIMDIKTENVLLHYKDLYSELTLIEKLIADIKNKGIIYASRHSLNYFIKKGFGR